MTFDRIQTCLVQLACFLAVGVPTCYGADKIVNITPTAQPNEAQYIESTKKIQLNVRVRVGDKITWINITKNDHTVTADVREPGGKPLFDLAVVPGDKKGQTLEFTQTFYDAAAKATGAKPGERIHLGYFCNIHPVTMGGKIVLDPAALKGASDKEH